jgi:hypothetical protein
VRVIIPTLCFGLLASLAVSPALAAQSTQSKSCSKMATQQGLTGGARATFRAKCMKGPLVASRPTAPTGPGKEAQAVTKPSGVDRTMRSKQCAAEADKRGLKAKDRKEFQLSCLATAGPVSESSTQNQAPRPAKAIPGIGVNNNQTPH